MSDTQAAFTKVQRIAAFKENIDALGRQWCIFVVAGTALKETYPGIQETNKDNELVMVPDRSVNLPTSIRNIKGKDVVVGHPLSTRFTSTWRAQEAIEKFVTQTWDAAEQAVKKDQKKDSPSKAALDVEPKFANVAKDKE